MTRTFSVVDAEPIVAELVRKLAEAGSMEILARDMHVTGCSIRRMLKAKRITLESADVWCDRVGSHLDILYPLEG